MREVAHLEAVATGRDRGYLVREIPYLPHLDTAATSCGHGRLVREVRYLDAAVPGRGLTCLVREVPSLQPLTVFVTAKCARYLTWTLRPSAVVVAA